MKKNIGIIFVVTLMVLTITSCTTDDEYLAYRDNGYALGTLIQITLYDDKEVEQEVFDRLFARLVEIENKMTINIDVNSDVEQINAAAGKEAVTVSDDTFYVIERGIYYTELTEGRFDISVGPIVEQWDIGFDGGQVPEAEAIEGALPLLGVNKITTYSGTHEVKLEEEGMILDLGGIAKGYAADELQKLLIETGCESAIIDLGGNILCHGSKPDGTGYNVGIRDPQGASSDYLGVLTVTNKTVVTSGVYERNFTEDGVLYHHIIDTSTGYPVTNELESVSIVADISIEGDALSTGVFAMGVSKGYDFISQVDGVEAIFVTSKGEVIVTEGLEDSFRVTNNEYSLVSRNKYE